MSTGQVENDPLLTPPALEPVTDNTAEFWTNLDRASDREFLHHLRSSRLHQRNVSFAAQQFGAQMLGMMLIGESEMPLQRDGECPMPAEEVPAADPFSQA